jgi:hypothetical protein
MKNYLRRKYESRKILGFVKQIKHRFFWIYFIISSTFYLFWSFYIILEFFKFFVFLNILSFKINN